MLNTMDGRENNGRFAKGNPGGPGRPPRATETAYLLAVADVMPPERWRIVVEQIADAAERGNMKAATWISKLLLGSQPAQLSEALAGVVLAGPQYRLQEILDKRILDVDELDDEEFERGERVRAMIKALDEAGAHGAVAGQG